MKTAVITGASSGLGREFVRQIVSQGLRGKILAESGCLQYDFLHR